MKQEYITPIIEIKNIDEERSLNEADTPVYGVSNEFSFN